MLPGKVSSIILLTSLLGVFGLPALVQTRERWTTYSNPRFGTAADYPASLFTQRAPPPENGDGQTFRTADGRAQLSIYGAYNVSADTPQSYLDNYFDFQGAVVGLKRATARFYVVSGTRDKNLFYERCNFPPRHDDVIDCLTITYPAADKAAWDAVVARVSRSLRNGRDLAPRR